MSRAGGAWRMRSGAPVRHEREPPVTCNAAVTCNGSLFAGNAAVTCNAWGALSRFRKSGSARAGGSTLRWERLGRLILLRAERVADEVVNGTLDRGVILPAFGVQVPLCD
jgi:hypothetical protein